MNWEQIFWRVILAETILMMAFYPWASAAGELMRGGPL